MEQNKTGKYLKYAIGEIVLVMIGILLALQVNNWNEGRRQQETVITYLNNLVSELEDDIEEYTVDSEQATFKFYSLQHLLILAGETPVKLHEDENVKPLKSDNVLWNKPLPEVPTSEFFELTFKWSIRGVSTYPNLSAITELNSTGSFSFIKNQSLKDAINDYYSTIEWRLGDEVMSYALRVRDNWQESLLKSGVLAQDVSQVENPLELLHGNKERVGYLRATIREAWFKASSLDLLKSKAEELIILINKEIEE